MLNLSVVGCIVPKRKIRTMFVRCKTLEFYRWCLYSSWQLNGSTVTRERRKCSMLLAGVAVWMLKKGRYWNEAVIKMLFSCLAIINLLFTCIIFSFIWVHSWFMYISVGNKESNMGDEKQYLQSSLLCLVWYHRTSSYKLKVLCKSVCLCAV